MGTLFLGTLFLGTLGPEARLVASDQVSVKRDGAVHNVVGEILVEAQDGGLLLQAVDQKLWIIQPGEIVSRSADDQPFQLMSEEQIAAQLQREFGEAFSIHRTAHYIICYNTSDTYAEWCGALYERLHRAFFTYWKSRGMSLTPPTGPLVALVFDSRNAFDAHARRDLGTEPGAMIGYYNMRTNWVNMYDLTELGRQATSTAHINRLLMQPRAERTVATIVHEATHQLAYNSGLQTRYADNPFWVSEGLAVFFETPDLRSSKGWRGIGEVNQVNMLQFKQYATRRPPNSLATLFGDDARFRDSKGAADAYAEAWALNYYLLRSRRDDYVKYLERLAAKKPMDELTAAQRLSEFTEVFGDLDEFDRQFTRFMLRVR